ncbi:MAG: hypothetical protein DWQ37_01715 [Planctomycetota bacterium]|nr:MAG: hypothetical protein DWQ37_01715 [Planctomycetota bacterium]
MTSHLPIRSAALLLLLHCACAASVARGLTIGADLAIVREPRPQQLLLAASGVSNARLDHYAARLDALAAEYAPRDDPQTSPRERAAAIHAYLHQHVLRGKYLASASDLGDVLDGGPFNCAAASALFLTLAARVGLDARPVSVKGHVWCRVGRGAETFDIETTCREWFAIAKRDEHLPTAAVPPAMAEHRHRVATGRELSDRAFRAIFHFNRGVTLIRQGRFPAAAAANRQALALDPACRPAAENLEFAQSHAAG